MAINNYKHNLNEPLQVNDLKVNGSLNASDAVLISGNLNLGGIATVSSLRVGTATSTGTASQPLQVTGGAYVSGSIGVGTTLPTATAQLEVIGNFRVGGSVGDSYVAAYSDASGSNASIEAINKANTIKKNLTLNAYGGSVLVGTATSTGTASQTLQVTGGTYVSGNLGIGSTNPFYTLHVKGQALIGGNSADAHFAVYDDNGGNNISLEAYNLANTIKKNITLNAYGGSVGVATTNPIEKLHAVGTIRADATTENYKLYNSLSSAGYRGSVDVDNDGFGLTARFNNNGFINFKTIIGGSLVEVARITNVGNLGIGSTQPTGQLNVPVGPVIIGSGTSTGTSAQVLQVSGIKSDVYIGGSIGLGTLTATARLTLPPGTINASTAPLKISAGTNLITPENGAFEFDGAILNFTPNAGTLGRTAIPLTVFTSGQGTSLSALSETTSTNLFPSANDTITLPIGTYSVMMNVSVTRGTVSSVSAQLRIRIGGNGTAAGSFAGVSVGSTTDGGQASSLLTNPGTLATDALVTPASTVSGGTYVAQIRGILKVTTAGTLIPQYSLSATLTGASSATTTTANNHMIIRSIASSGTVASVGAFS